MSVHKVELDARMIAWMQNELLNGRFEAENDDQQRMLHRTVGELAVTSQAADLMARGTEIRDATTFTLYEHPDGGDEVPLMIWSKEMKRLFVHTGFYDDEGDEEIARYLDGQIALHH